MSAVVLVVEGTGEEGRGRATNVCAPGGDGGARGDGAPGKSLRSRPPASSFASQSCSLATTHSAL